MRVEDYGSISPLSRNAEILLFLYMCTECTGPPDVQMFRMLLAEGAAGVVLEEGETQEEHFRHRKSRSFLFPASSFAPPTESFPAALLSRGWEVVF